MGMLVTRGLRSEMKCKAGGSAFLLPCGQGSGEPSQRRRRAAWMIWSQLPKRISAPKWSIRFE